MYLTIFPLFDAIFLWICTVRIKVHDTYFVGMGLTFFKRPNHFSTVHMGLRHSVLFNLKFHG